MSAETGESQPPVMWVADSNPATYQGQSTYQVVPPPEAEYLPTSDQKLNAYIGPCISVHPIEQPVKKSE